MRITSNIEGSQNETFLKLIETLDYVAVAEGENELAIPQRQKGEMGKQP